MIARLVCRILGHNPVQIRWNKVWCTCCKKKWGTGW